MKKLLTIAVPCYNSQDYMHKCIESLLVGGEEVEIIIVDDGSKDDTAKIADEYAAKYPTIIRAVHQENGGHGDAVNTGLREATGEYFKVVDSDDRVAKDAYMKILDVIRKTILEEKRLDMLLSNYVYDKVGTKRKKVMKYTSELPVDTYFTWDEVGFFKNTEYLMMHSIIYRTELLRECGLKLPKHTFYVDNIFVFFPLPYVKVMYYLDVNFYWYFIGREDQSVHEEVMIKRLDQQIFVNRILIRDYNSSAITSKKCATYMKNHLSIVMTVSSILCIMSKSDENMAKKKELWAYLKEKDRKLWRRVRFSVLGIWMNFPGRLGRKLSKAGYKIVQKIYGFN